MKKIAIIAIVLMMVPVMVFAEPESTTGGQDTITAAGIRGENASEKAADIKSKLVEASKRRELIQTFVQTKEQIKAQTKEQIQTAKAEVKNLKMDMKSKFSGLKDLTADEREAMKDEIKLIKDEMKVIHKAALDLRKASVEEIKPINEAIKTIVTTTVVTDEEVDSIDNIIEDL